jgi:outer membrane receptor protein involved in Fe transport
MKVAAGAEYRESDFAGVFETPGSAKLTSGGHRRVKTLFAETRLPLWGEGRRARGLERLELSAAARYEEYSDFGRSVTPRYAIEWAPLRSLTLHASSSRSFRAPSLVDLSENNNAFSIVPLPDPSLPGGRALALIWSGKNADLREETAHSWTTGISFEPRAVPRLSLAATYYDIDFTNRIDSPSPTLLGSALTDPHLASMVTRNPSPELIAEVCSRAPISAFPINCTAVTGDVLIDFRLRNDASVHTRGLDLTAGYAVDTSSGTVALKLSGNYIIDFEEASTPGVPAVDRVSTPSYPVDLRLRGSVGWQRGGLDIVAYVNYADHYRDTVSIPERRVRSWTTLDTTVTYKLSAGLGGRLGETSLSLAAMNLFDRDPPFLNNLVGVGYDQENADIMGRIVSFTIRQKW